MMKQKDWKPAFLDALSETGNVAKACRKARISRQRAYALRKEDEAFAAAWDEAEEASVATILEPEAIRRAVEGTLKPVFYQGTRCGAVREYSDTLLIVLLKARAPDKYADRLRQSSTNVNIDFSRLTDEQLERIAHGEDPAFVAATPGPGAAGTEEA